MKKVLSLLVSLSMLLMAFSLQLVSAETPTNLIVNGGFENGNEGWLTQSILTVQSNVKYAGNSAGYVSGRKSVQSTYYQSVSVEANKVYLFTAMVKLEDSQYNGAAITLYPGGMTADEKPFSETVNATADDWTELRFTLMPKETKTVNICVVNWTDAAINYYIDELKLIEINKVISLDLYGQTVMNAPENGVEKIKIRADVRDEDGNSYPVDTWSVSGDTKGVSIDDDGVLTANYLAGGNVTVSASTKNFENPQQPIIKTHNVEIIPYSSNKDQNLISNGDFETITDNLWSNNIKIVSKDAAEGNFCALFENGVAASQKVVLESGKKYLFKTKIKSKAGNDNFFVSADSQNVTVTSNTLQAEDALWHTMVAVIDGTNLQNDTDVNISINGTTAFFLDNVTLSEYVTDSSVKSEFVFSKDGERVDKLTNGDIHISTKFINGTVPKSIIAISALYEDNRLSKVIKTDKVDLSLGDETTVEVGTISVTNASEQKLKNFVINAELSPKAETISLEPTEVRNIYVSPTGNDNGSGTIEDPFATLRKAGDFVATIKNQLPKDGAIIWLRGGTYYLTDDTSQRFFSQHSDIVYKAYPNETPVLTGAKDLPKTMFTKVTDEDILSRVIDTNARTELVQINLGEAGINSLGGVYYSGSYSVKESKAAMPELIINGKLMTTARYPNDGYLKVGEGATVNENGFTLKLDDTHLSKWGNAKDAMMYGKFKWTWADQSVPIASVDTVNNTITSGHKSHYDVLPEGRYYVYNLLEEIDMPGEYYIDRESKVLYLYPPEEGVASASLTMMTKPIVFANTANNMTFDGITFTGTRGTVDTAHSGEGQSGIAVEVYSGNGILFKNCTFENMSGKVAYVAPDCKNVGFDSCIIRNTNGGIELVGGKAKDANLELANCFVQNCSFDNFSRLTRTFNAAVVINGAGNSVNNNTIKNAPHNAIQLSGRGHSILYNDISDVLQEADDMSAIYMGGSWMSRGNKINYNYIHNLNPSIYGGAGSGAYGVYLDNCFSSAEVKGNIFADITTENACAVVINGGRDNHVENNLIINTTKYFWITDIGTTQDMSDFTSSLDTFPVYKSDVWKKAYPELYSILDNEPLKPVGNTFINNAIYNGGVETVWVDDTSVFDNENNIKLTDKNDFVDFNSKDYSVSDNSSIFEKIKGFPQLSKNMVGCNLSH